MRTIIYGILLAAGIGFIAVPTAQALPGGNGLTAAAGTVAVPVEQVAKKKKTAKKAAKRSRSAGPRASTRSAGEGQPSGQTPPTR